MSVLVPFGFVALLSLPVILLLHLIRERRKRVQVPSLQLWQNLPRTRAGERPRALPLTVLLLLHLLVAALLALALTQPQLLANLVRGDGQMALVIDTSTSMRAADGTGTRMDSARAEARALLAGLTPETPVALVAAGPQARLIAAGQAGDATLLATLDGLTAGGSGANLEQGVALGAAALAPGQPGRVVVLTDGNTTVAAERLNVPVEWDIIGGAAQNRGFVAFDARPFGANVQLYGRIANESDSPFQGDVVLYGDERELERRSLTIAANSQGELTWRVPAGYATVRAAFAGADALPDDDEARLNIAGLRPLRVALVSSAPEAMQRALAATPNISVETIAPTAYQRQPADISVFDGFVPATLPAGALLFINPPAENSLFSVAEQPAVVDNATLQARGILSDLSFGGVDFGATVPRVATPDWATTLLSADATPLVLRGQFNGQQIAVWAFGLGSSNLPTRLAFPLLVTRTIRDLAPETLPRSVAAGATLTYRPGTQVAAVALDGVTTPVSTTATLAVPAAAGFYTLTEEGGLAAFSTPLAVNAGSPLEADLRQQPLPASGQPQEQTGAPVQRIIDIWPWLAAAALLVLLAEWLYTHRRTGTTRAARP